MVTLVDMPFFCSLISFFLQLNILFSHLDIFFCILISFFCSLISFLQLEILYFAAWYVFCSLISFFCSFISFFVAWYSFNVAVLPPSVMEFLSSTGFIFPFVQENVSFFDFGFDISTPLAFSPLCNFHLYVLSCRQKVFHTGGFSSFSSDWKLLSSQQAIVVTVHNTFLLLLNVPFFLFLSDPSPIIVYPCHSLTDWLTH